MPLARGKLPAPTIGETSAHDEEPYRPPGGAEDLAVSTGKLILLDAHDNVLVCAAPIAAGEAIVIDGGTVAAPQAVAVGHKVARRDLAPGDKVLKYGAPIGSMTDGAPRGG